MKRKYPYQAWVVSPAYVVKEVTIIGSTYSNGWDRTDTGKSYHINALHVSKKAAIAAGRAEVVKAEADLVKRRQNLDKKIAQLNKAEGK